MAPRTASVVAPKKSAKSAASGTARTGRTAARAGGPRGVAFDIGALVSEVRNLRSLRERYNTLVKEHNGLLGTLKDLSSELGTSARNAWSSYKGSGELSASALKSRVRTASDAVDAQYDKLAEVLPGAWTSKSEICKAAGLNARECNTAFRRLVTGFKRGGKSFPARLDSNGKRGTEGRYRKK